MVRQSSTCDVVLEKCTKAVRDLKKTVDVKNKVIATQDELIVEHEKEIKRSHKATKTAITTGFSVSSVLLLLLLL